MRTSTTTTTTTTTALKKNDVDDTMKNKQNRTLMLISLRMSVEYFIIGLKIIAALEGFLTNGLETATIRRWFITQR